MWHSSAQQKTIPTNAVKRIHVSSLTKKQPIHFSFAVLFDWALQSNHQTNDKKVGIFIYLILQVISKCLELETALLLEFNV